MGSSSGLTVHLENGDKAGIIAGYDGLTVVRQETGPVVFTPPLRKVAVRHRQARPMQPIRPHPLHVAGGPQDKHRQTEVIQLVAVHHVTEVHQHDIELGAQQTLFGDMGANHLVSSQFHLHAGRSPTLYQGRTG